MDETAATAIKAASQQIYGTVVEAVDRIHQLEQLSLGQERELRRLRSVLEMIAIPPRDDEEIGCAGCSRVAQAALDGQPNTGYAALVEELEELRAIVTAARDWSTAHKLWIEKARGEGVSPVDEVSRRRTAMAASLQRLVDQLDVDREVADG